MDHEPPNDDSAAACCGRFSCDLYLLARLFAAANMALAGCLMAALGPPGSALLIEAASIELVLIVATVVAAWESGFTAGLHRWHYAYRACACVLILASGAFLVAGKDSTAAGWLLVLGAAAQAAADAYLQEPPVWYCIGRCLAAAVLLMAGLALAAAPAGNLVLFGSLLTVSSFLSLGFDAPGLYLQFAGVCAPPRHGAAGGTPTRSDALMGLPSSEATV